MKVRFRTRQRQRRDQPSGTKAFGKRSIPGQTPAIAPDSSQGAAMIRKLASGQFRLYSRKTDPKTGKRKNLGTFKSRAAAEAHERAVQYFKRH
jgi:hypothetical protein